MVGAKIEAHAQETFLLGCFDFLTRLAHPFRVARNPDVAFAHPFMLQGILMSL